MEVERKELFKVRFSKYYPVLCHTAAGYVADADDCEDIVQDLFVSVWNHEKARPEIDAFFVNERKIFDV